VTPLVLEVDGTVMLALPVALVYRYGAFIFHQEDAVVVEVVVAGGGVDGIAKDGIERRLRVEAVPVVVDDEDAVAAAASDDDDVTVVGRIGNNTLRTLLLLLLVVLV
jgi:hypothetical protein